MSGSQGGQQLGGGAGAGRGLKERRPVRGGASGGLDRQSRPLAAASTASGPCRPKASAPILVPTRHSACILLGAPLGHETSHIRNEGVDTGRVLAVKEQGFRLHGG